MKPLTRLTALLLIAMTIASSGIAQTTVDIDSTASVMAYYPNWEHIGLAFGTMPSQADGSVIFVAEAAFTHALLYDFAHSNIDGDHVADGIRYTGADCRDNSGAFVAWGDHWEFVSGDYSAALDSAVAHGGMGFGQALIIYDGVKIEPLWRTGDHEYRALCERNGRLCIVDSRGRVSYGQFVNSLVDYGVTHALYLDMGSGWNHSWWRDGTGIVHEIHPRIPKSHFCTNWITFYQ